MADSKKRFLLVPDDAWAEATLVSATSQDGLTVTQPKTDTALGDLRIVVSGEPTESVTEDIRITRDGVVGDLEYAFVDDTTSRNAWLTAQLGVLSDRPDLLVHEESTTNSYHIPVAFCAHEDNQHVSLLYHRTSRRHGIMFADSYMTVLGTGGFEQLRRFVLDLDTNEWSTSELLSSVTASAWAACKDTFGHLVFAVNYGDIAVYESTDDFSSLVLRSTVATPSVYSYGFVTTADAVVLSSGRIILAVARTKGCSVLVSDDRGLSWQEYDVLSYGTPAGSLPAGYSSVSNVSLHVQSNGIAVLSLSYVGLDGATSADDSVYITNSVVVVGGGLPNTRQLYTSVYASSSGEVWSGGTLEVEDGLLGLSMITGTEGYPTAVGLGYIPENYTGTRSASGAMCLAMLAASDGVLSSAVPQQGFLQATNPSGNKLLLSLYQPGADFRVVSYAARALCNTDTATPWQGVHTRPVLGLFRGRLLAAVGTASEEITAGSTTLTVTETGLAVLPVQQRTNLMERLPQSNDTSFYTGGFTPFGSSGMYLGRGYYSCWTCWEYPDTSAWVRTTAGGVSAVIADRSSADEQTGWLRTSAGVTDKLYWDRQPDLLPNNKGADVVSQDGLTSVSRLVVRPEQGGSKSRDELFYRISLYDRNKSAGLGAGYDVSLRFAVSGLDVTWALYDNVSGGTLATGIFSSAADQWLEVVLGITEYGTTYSSPAPMLSLYWRNLSVEQADRLVPFEKELTDLPISTGAVAGDDLIRFGHETVLQSVSAMWKAVHVSRNNLPPQDYLGAVHSVLTQETPSALVADVLNQRLSEYNGEVDALYGDRLIGQGTGPRGIRVGAAPAYFRDGVFLSAAGRAVRGGETAIATAFDYEASHVLPVSPVAQEYRSSGTQVGTYLAETATQELVFSVDTLLGDGLAIFGRNTPQMRIQLNDTNTWSSPLVDLEISDPVFSAGSPSPRVEYGHLFASTDSAALRVEHGGLSFSTASGHPWRKHQFASQSTGQKFYVAVDFSHIADPVVYRIKDNTTNHLILETAIAFTGLVPNVDYAVDGFAVYSDRVAFSLEDLVSASLSPGETTAGFSYVKVTLYECQRADADEQFHRLGALWFGSLFNLSEPDFEWQWSRVAESGNTRTDTPGGATYSKRNRQFRRIFTASKPTMQSARVANGLDSPQEQIRGSWEEFINLTERLEIDGKRCALIWQGERAEAGSQVDPVQRTADPLELIACRMDSGGTLQNDAYSCQNMTLGSSGLTAVPRPRASIAQIQFREEF